MGETSGRLITTLAASEGCMVFNSFHWPVCIHFEVHASPITLPHPPGSTVPVIFFHHNDTLQAPLTSLHFSLPYFPGKWYSHMQIMIDLGSGALVPSNADLPTNAQITERFLLVVLGHYNFQLVSLIKQTTRPSVYYGIRV